MHNKIEPWHDNFYIGNGYGTYIYSTSGSYICD